MEDDMGLFNRKIRRRTFNAGLASLAAAAAGVPEAGAAVDPAKRPGETKIVAIMGDYWHNGVAQEYHIRKILSPEKKWRIIFVRGPQYFNPELIADADLLIMARYDGNDNMGYSEKGLVDTMEAGAPLWTDENVAAIIENVRKRGMGFMPLHCTLFCGVRDITELMGIEPIMHRQIQPIWMYGFNQDHPITKGIGKFWINLDEQFAAVIKSQYTTSLFQTQAMHDKRTAVGGWCLENGNGRVVGLLPGHTHWPYHTSQYKDILWRSAHWSMRKEVTPHPGAKKGY